MRRYGPAVLLALVGAAILRVSLFSELYLRYVQEGLRPYLVVSGVVLVLLGVVVAVLVRTDGEDPEHGHAHGPAGPRVAWLLTLPALALLLFPPPALGSYSAEREAAQRAAQGVGSFPALPSGDPVDLTLGEFGSRAVYDSARSLKGRTIRLTGFVTRGDGGTWYVTRLLVSCCAADATTAKAEVRGADAPPVDTWVTVTGTWRPRGALGSSAAWPPVVDVTSVRRVAQPDNPYEKR
ncbi:TIGR03943 family putative permease subunit [Streptomyces lomondensis]|uniref:Membrane protein n=1 Tax=Streptomyces lomondensis TaxID=68229 RepID=A0ABQ2XHF3_9ACTN|nr:TIGR03943 family protein [Streptomyces lomondensis]MCF0077500.1 TIGR03943 family protein [Streptomyces lomondensis]GGX17700.1 membrane protein [Streptomyces lomondensis]